MAIDIVNRPFRQRLTRLCDRLVFLKERVFVLEVTPLSSWNLIGYEANFSKGARSLEAYLVNYGIGNVPHSCTLDTCN